MQLICRVVASVPLRFVKLALLKTYVLLSIHLNTSSSDIHWPVRMRIMTMVGSLRTTLEMIKWEHSIFALPFALCGAMLAAGRWPSWWQLLWIIVCMVSARSAAMAFNRLVDVKIDAENPRTRSR